PNVDLAAVIADDLADEGQAQAGPLLARREERREDLFAQLGRHSGAVVAHLKPYQGVVGLGADPDATLARRRDRVARQVEQRAPQLHGVRAHGQPVRRADLHHGTAGDGGQLADLLEQGPQRDGFHAQPWTPRELQELVHDRLQVADLALDAR